MPNEELPLTSDKLEEQNANLEDTLALCLSGGGYRAMLFHLGTLWYLNDAGYLPRLDRVSSVSGGSITAGVLATRWKQLQFDASGKAPNFGNVVVVPIRKMASTTIDVGSVLGGIFTPGTTISDKIIKHYRKTLFGNDTLQSFPDQPRFVINATNVQTGSLFRFSKPFVADYRVGLIRNPTVGVAEAVAASSAFPPVLSPARLEFHHSQWSELNTAECGHPPFTTEIVLSDGGVYDNLGIETVWKRCKRVLVSDGGGKYQPEENPSAAWVQHSIRINATIDNQVRSLRKRQIIGEFANPGSPHTGAYWSMWTNPGAYPAPNPLPVDAKRADELARISTRLSSLSNELQNRVINFGYAMADRAVRSYYDPNAFRPTAFPCPGGV